MIFKMTSNCITALCQSKSTFESTSTKFTTYRIDKESGTSARNQSHTPTDLVGGAYMLTLTNDRSVGVVMSLLSTNKGDYRGITL